MTGTKFNISDVIRDTDAFGTVTVIDIFKSTATGQYCYCVRLHDNENTMLCWEGELLTGVWKVT